MQSINSRPHRPMFRGRDLTAGPVIGYGSQPIRHRRRARAQARRLKAAVILLFGIGAVMLGNSAFAFLQNLITIRH